jgi:hypothetical protein
MMQADTVQSSSPNPIGGDEGQGQPITVRGTVPDYTANFWRILPILFGAAAWLPQIWSSLAAFGRLPSGSFIAPISGGYFQKLVGNAVGPDGLIVAGAMLSGLIAYAVWALARAIGAPRWAASVVASISFVSPLFGLAPSPALALDDAAFGAFMTLALAGVVWTGRREDSNCLMVAFILAIIAATLRPGAAWPAIAIGIGALLASNKLEEGPWVGMLSSLCWAPGLYFAHHLLVGDTGAASLYAEPSVVEKMRQSAAASVGAVDSATLSLPVILNGLLTAIPFVIFGSAAIIGLGIAFLLGKGRRRGAIAGAIGGGLSVLGAAGYGSFDAARLLLDPIFLGLAAAIGLILPALIKRLKTQLERSTGQSDRV